MFFLCFYAILSCPTTPGSELFFEVLMKLFFVVSVLTTLSACVSGGTISFPVDDSLGLTLALDETHPATVLATGSGEHGCFIAWSADGKDHTTIPTVADGILSAVLFGATASTEVTARTVCSPSDEGPDSVITTGAFPSDLPSLEAVTPMSESLEKEYILTSGFDMVEGSGSITISTLDGDPVWWESSPGSLINDAHFDAETQTIYGMRWAKSTDTDGGLFIAPLAGATEVFSAPYSHHDALALGNGQYLITQVVRQDTEEYGDVAGDTLSILDTVTGTISVVWNAFDQLEVVENDGWALNPPDWTHINGLSRDMDTGKIYASLYYDHSILQIDAVTWQTDWQLGGASPDFAVDVPFGPQHSPLHRGDSLWMFNNGKDSAIGSGLVKYDLSNDVAMRTWDWYPESTTFCIVMGSVDVYDDAIIASWGDTGDVRILSPNDDSILASYIPRIGGQAGYTSLVNVK